MRVMWAVGDVGNQIYILKGSLSQPAVWRTDWQVPEGSSVHQSRTTAVPVWSWTMFVNGTKVNDLRSLKVKSKTWWWIYGDKDEKNFKNNCYVYDFNSWMDNYTLDSYDKKA